MATGSIAGSEGNTTYTESRQSVTDTEVICGLGGVPSSDPTPMFVDFNAFKNTSSGTGFETKKRPRHSSQGGSGSGLPPGTSLRWRELRGSIDTGLANIQYPNNAKYSTQREALRTVGALEMKIQNNTLFYMTFRDLVSFTDSKFESINLSGAVMQSPMISERGGRPISVPDITSGKNKSLVLSGGLDWLEPKFSFQGMGFTGAQNNNIAFIAALPFYFYLSLDGVSRYPNVSA